MSKSIAFGFENVNEDSAVGWSTWKSETGYDATIYGNADYGRLALSYGIGAQSDVFDTGDTKTKKITIDKNKYTTAYNSPIFYIRGDSDQFYKENTEVNWELYVAGMKRAWRYMQVMARSNDETLLTTTTTTTSSSSTSSSSSSSSTTSTSSSSSTTTTTFDYYVSDLVLGWSTTSSSSTTTSTTISTTSSSSTTTTTAT